MAQSDLVIRVKGDVKDATAKLKELGVNVEMVEAKTKKATESQSIWDKTIEKGAQDNIKNLVNMGAKILTITGLVTGLSKAVKSCLDEALKQDSIAKTRLTEIQSVWSTIKADFGQGLLDSVSPALQNLYEWLVEVEKEVARMSNASGINSALISSYKGNKDNQNYHYDFSDKTTGALEVALESLQNANNPHGQTAATQWAIDQLSQELAWRLEHGGNSYGTYGKGLSGKEAEGIKLNWGKTMEETYWEQYGLHVAKQGNQQPAYQKAEQTLQELLNEASADLTVNDDGRAAAKSKWGFYGGNYSVKLGKYLNETGSLYWDEQARAWKSVDDLIQKATTSTSSALDTALENWKKYYSTITSYAQNTFSSIASLMSTIYDEQIYQTEHSEMAEEEKAEKIQELKRKQFESDKANSIAQATIDTASAIMNIWASNGGHPVVNSILTGLATVAGAAQIATIDAQSYHAFAEGGIVSQPIHAMIGEGGEKEAILPLSKLKDFVKPETSGGTINLTVNVTDRMGSGDIAQEVYYGIERAQRTGLLPRWKYA